MCGLPNRSFFISGHALPSPEALKRKILIKNKKKHCKPAASASAATAIPEEADAPTQAGECEEQSRRDVFYLTQDFFLAGLTVDLDSGDSDSDYDEDGEDASAGGDKAAADKEGNSAAAAEGGGGSSVATPAAAASSSFSAGQSLHLRLRSAASARLGERVFLARILLLSLTRFPKCYSRWRWLCRCFRRRRRRAGEGVQGERRDIGARQLRAGSQVPWVRTGRK